MTELRKRGVAAAVICSDQFAELAKAQSRVLGVADPLLVIIPHPLGGLEIAEVEARAELALSQVRQLIEDLIK